jgi:hypothetical protein
MGEQYKQKTKTKRFSNERGFPEEPRKNNRKWEGLNKIKRRKKERKSNKKIYTIIPNLIKIRKEIFSFSRENRMDQEL